MRKGMRIGSGKKGYYNVIGTDPRVHRQSAMGMKQPQRMPFMSINPAIVRYSNEKLQEGTVKEHIEHPKFSMSQARQIAKDHLTENPRAYGKKPKIYQLTKTQEFLLDNLPKNPRITLTELSTKSGIPISQIFDGLSDLEKKNFKLKGYWQKGGKQPKVEWVIETKKFRNKKTGEIVTQIPILEMDDYEEVKGGKLPPQYTFQDLKAQTIGLMHKYKRSPNFASLPKAEQKKLISLENKIKTATTAKDIKSAIKNNAFYFGLIGASTAAGMIAVDPITKVNLYSTAMLFTGLEGGRMGQQIQEIKKEMKLAKKYVNKNFPDIPDKQKEDLAARLARYNVQKGGKSYNLKIDAQVNKKNYKGNVKLNLPDKGMFGGKMSAKDYEAIAKIMGSSRNLGEADARIAFYMEQDNPKFDRIKYINATKEWDRKAKGGMG